jgi:hypothetical protein
MNTLLPFSFIAIVAMLACTSPAKVFDDEVEALISTSHSESGLITEMSVNHLPEPVQRYFHYSGFIDLPLSAVTEVLWADTKIKLGPEQAWKNLKTRQFNFTATGSRLAYMNARMAWVIPFEGRDRYHNGRGHMLGTVARTFKVFDNQSREVTLGGAVVLLAEALLEPSIALQEYMTWEPVDNLTARATFRDGDITVSGIFRFNEAGEFIRFESDDRPYEVSGGVYEPKPFSIDLEEYHEADGLKIAGRVFATWHLEGGDFTYWDGRITGLRRNAKN